MRPAPTLRYLAVPSKRVGPAFFASSALFGGMSPWQHVRVRARHGVGLMLALGVSSAACSGRLGEPVGADPVTGGSGSGSTGNGGGSVSDPDPFPSDPDDPVSGTPDCTVQAPSVPLTRLARAEYEASLRALVGDAPVNEVADLLATLPEDDLADEQAFSRQDQRVSDRHVEGQFRIAEAVAAAVADSNDARARVFGACARDPMDGTCLEGTLPDLLRRAYRRPPTSDEVEAARMAASAFDGAEAFEAALFLSLMSPDFLYRFENRGQRREDGALTLTPHELASRLSFHFWGLPPDAELAGAANDGSLVTEAGYRAQVERLAADPRTEQTLLAFFREWLHLGRGGFADSPRLDVLRDGMDVSGLAAAMREEVEALLRHHLNDPDLTWTDALTSRESFATDPRVAEIYGVEPWDGSSPRPVLDSEERSGILTRAGVLYTADGSTNPFRRGAFVRKSLLCDPVSPPPADLPPGSLDTPEPQPGISTREAFAGLVTDATCADCHALFSDLGYALEAYDGLGRFRTMERLVRADGTEHGTAVVDAMVVPRIDFSDDRPTLNPAELSERIAESPKANACLAERYLQFTLRKKPAAAEYCTVQRMADRLDQGESLREALVAVAYEPSFRIRAVEN